MHTLIVKAHPSSKGFTHRIADAYKRGKESKGDTVEVLDLYKTDLQQPFLAFENIREDLSKPDPVRAQIQEKITKADNIVFVHPLWWVGMPAILKNFIDVNFSAHFAFKYVNGRPVGLLKGKTSSVFITCDGSLWIYRLLTMPFKTIWKYPILRLCGLKVQAFEVFDKKLFRSEAEQEAFLKKVESIAVRS
ncbi:MAG: NAD(P)H-dependent oxidoreductase [Candidatus Taylorbacteria bacterium]|nr:NAD(P)H-dependent oxidoreductase [Candidatus Taylorbacteria bacterium]